MIIFLNGKFVPEAQATVSVLDRGFLYGDGLFEALRISHGKPFRWNEHMERLQRGAAFLKIYLPCAPEELLARARQLVEQNAMPDSILRISLSRGVGRRGYSPEGANQPTLVMTVHPMPQRKTDSPPGLRVITASIRLHPDDPLAGFKTANKLPQILARAEADAAGADDALLLNTHGHVVEGSGSNLFWMADDCVRTAPLPSGILGGVTRRVILELCKNLGIPSREESITPEKLLQTRGAFLSLSSWGVVELAALDGKNLPRSPLTAKLRAAYDDLVRRETD